VQGNLDPEVLHATPEVDRRRTEDIIKSVAGRPGHIMNLGHGILPETPVENVLEFIATVQQK
jgi:uroporphyrinogen decarboxylase